MAKKKKKKIITYNIRLLSLSQRTLPHMQSGDIMHLLSLSQRTPPHRGHHVPVILIPEEHADGVDDVGLVELYRDALAPVSSDGVGGVAVLSCVVLRVPIEQGLLGLSLNGAGPSVRSGHILFWNYSNVYSKRA